MTPPVALTAFLAESRLLGEKPPLAGVEARLRLLARLVVRPADPAGKVQPLQVGTKESDEIVSQAREISDHGHRLPATGVRVEAEPEVPRAQRGGPSDRDIFVHGDD